MLVNGHSRSSFMAASTAPLNDESCVLSRQRKHVCIVFQPSGASASRIAELRVSTANDGGLRDSIALKCISHTTVTGPALGSNWRVETKCGTLTEAPSPRRTRPAGEFEILPRVVHS